MNELSKMLNLKSDNVSKKVQTFKKAVKFEQEYQIALSRIERRQAVPFLHRSLLPLDQVDFSTDEDHGQQVMFGNECEGMCGV